MKNLDTSIANQGILDESFSNALGNLVENNPSVTKTISKPTEITRISSNPIPDDSRKVFVKPTTVTRLSEPSGSGSSSPTSQIPDAPSYPVFSGGGGGGIGASDSSSDDSTKKEATVDEMLFGFKAKYVYGAAALGLVTFVYFKFIKK